MAIQTQSVGAVDNPPLIPLNTFGRQLDRTPPTIWRWRKLGWIDSADICNVAGKPYISRAGIEKFTRRAQAGEFSRPSHAPKRSKAALP